MNIKKTDTLHKHIKGLYEDYDIDIHKDCIYFATDEEQIIVNGLEYGGSNYWYDVKERDKFLVYEITTEETDNVEFADSYKLYQAAPFLTRTELQLPTPGEYFIDWGDGQTELFKSNTEELSQEIIDSIKGTSNDDIKKFLLRVDGGLISHTYNDKKEHNIKIYIYNPDLYEEYLIDDDMDIYQYPNPVLLNLNCKPKLIKHNGINNKSFPIIFNLFYVESSPELILDNEIEKILDLSLGKYNFKGDLILPESLNSIGDLVFNECSGLTGDLIIPNNVTHIGNRAFNNCRFDGKLVLSESLISIGDKVFKYCAEFTGELKLPNKIKTIGDGAFEGCSEFTGDLIIPDSVTHIGVKAFSECGFDGKLVLSKSLNIIEDSVFFGCSLFKGDLIIPEGVTSIGDNAFGACEFDGKLTLPESLISIGKGAFEGSYEFNGELKLPKNLKTIGDDAFSYCSEFTGELIIPDSVVSIGNEAFNECRGLSKIYVCEDTILEDDWNSMTTAEVIKYKKGETPWLEK